MAVPEEGITSFQTNGEVREITGEADNDSVMEDRPLENENGLIDIDKLSPIHCTPTKSSDRVDGDGAIWQKIHAEDSML